MGHGALGRALDAGVATERALMFVSPAAGAFWAAWRASGRAAPALGRED